MATPPLRLTDADRAVLAYTFQQAESRFFASLPTAQLRVLASITPETPYQPRLAPETHA